MVYQKVPRECPQLALKSAQLSKLAHHPKGMFGLDKKNLHLPIFLLMKSN